MNFFAYFLGRAYIEHLYCLYLVESLFMEYVSFTEVYVSEYCQMVFQSEFTSLPSHQEHQRIPVDPYPHGWEIALDIPSPIKLPTKCNYLSDLSLYQMEHKNYTGEPSPCTDLWQIITHCFKSQCFEMVWNADTDKILQPLRSKTFSFKIGMKMFVLPTLENLYKY